ncbi:amino acid ABC transporter permease [Acuticoccus sp. I52.16.1]|uniref:amino acid ABC transporter permease n=1 Tax=Acuticoccus sp. I52.16.1 TaxID=2928472 RepID=UPI001FD3A1AC|nr:amino acid ABC transporter permease [Acuticoccus sp. I52.16.1]UOM35148.1 amino acid ABC transporter permease [Acuticoccus sp. I52.16.1]
MEFRFFEIWRSEEYLLRLLEGAGFSIALAAAGGIVGFVLAMALASARYFNVPVAAQIAVVYVEFVRNTPLIVQLFFVAFGLPMLLGYAWPFWAHAALALTLNFSAYFAEILRAGLFSIAKGQVEAARALGLSTMLAFRKVILPQAVAAVYPSLNSQFIFLFLTTGIVAEIGVPDLTSAGLYIDSRTFRSFEVFTVLTVMYVVIALGFKAGLTVLQHRLFSWQRAR